MRNSSSDYLIQVHADPAELPLADWDELLDQQAKPTPFMRLAYLRALHDSGSAVADTGWQPQFLSVWQGNTLMAACPAYLKSHSYGEYVFDWAWADAYQRHGLRYYPKLLVAVPFTPVPGSRLLARDAASRRALVQGLRGLSSQLKLSSAHVLFNDEADLQALQAEDWLQRRNVQFHWQNSPPGYASFEDFLASLQRDKRKKIQQEQRRVREAGVSFEVLQGSEIAPADWDFFYRCYTLTYQAHRSTPYLQREFFTLMSAHMAEHWLLFIAKRQANGGEERVAASLIAVDPVRGAAYGRYWGALESISCLHFDACYYQPLAWCIEHGYQRFEGGAQGEHKMARGLLPVGTHSAHWLAHPQFREAVAEFLGQEGQAMHDYVSELDQHQPFRSTSGNTSAP